GYHQVESEWWDFLPLHGVKGQTATFTFEETLPLPCSVSSLGYMAFMKLNPSQITTGSTYEHKFEHTKPTPEGLKRLKEKLDNTFPGYTEKSISSEQWAGVRVTLPDKKPVIGSHPEIRGLALIGALGSKGLLLGRYLAEELVSHILDGEDIAPTVSVQRYLSTG
ncbi:MAG: FAD-dependent oxidoreductase, partial [Balneolaceae bacterium]|nr:FAD-dependent oxidoreductase [Balneolaceae bacterium]